MNKYITLLLSVALLSFATSCKVKQGINQNTDTIVVDDDKVIVSENENTPKPTTETEPAKDNVVIEDSIVKEDEPTFVFKDEYHIALILPLMEDSILNNWENHKESDLKDFAIPPMAQKAMDFLNGMQLALEGKNFDFTLNIEIFDNYADYNTTQNIVKQLEVRNTDLIIAPIKKQNIHSISNFAKQKNITVLSPFSPSSAVSNNFERYIMVEPSIQSHFETMVQYINDSIENKSIKIIYPNTNNGIKLSNLLQKQIAQQNDSIKNAENKMQYAQIEVEARTNERKNFEIKDYLDQDKTNVAIVASFNDGFTHSMLTQLNKELKEHQIIVFGMPNWYKSKTLRLNYFNKLYVHYTTPNYIDVENITYQNLKNTYSKKHQRNINEDALLGYDVMQLIPTFLSQYGVNFAENISTIDTTYNGLLSNYHFKNIYNTPSDSVQIIRVENKSIRILSYKDFQLVLEK